MHVHMSNKRKMCSSVMKNEYLKNSIRKLQQKHQRESNSECTDHMPDTLSSQLWKKLHFAVDNILLIKRYVVLIRS